MLAGDAQASKRVGNGQRATRSVFVPVAALPAKGVRESTGRERSTPTARGDVRPRIVAAGKASTLFFLSQAASLRMCQHKTAFRTDPSHGSGVFVAPNVAQGDDGVGNLPHVCLRSVGAESLSFQVKLKFRPSSIHPPTNQLDSPAPSSTLEVRPSQSAANYRIQSKSVDA